MMCQEKGKTICIFLTVCCMFYIYLKNIYANDVCLYMMSHSKIDMSFQISGKGRISCGCH